MVLRGARAEMNAPGFIEQAEPDKTPARRRFPHIRLPSLATSVTRKDPLTSTFSVDLPGIESATKNSLNWGNAEFDCAKRADTASVSMTSTL